MMSVRILLIALSVSLMFSNPAAARPELAEADGLAYREKVAAADTRFAASWIADAYEVPDRVVEELLYGGYSYAETLIAMAFMGEGLSLNDILEQRGFLGGARWGEVAETLGLDTNSLPIEIRELLWFGRNQTKPPVLHFLPDPKPGIRKALVIPPFSPTVPSNITVDRFKLSRRDVENIRKVLRDPLGVPDSDLLLPAGKGLYTADWVLAGTVSYFKPFPMETLLAARLGEEFNWSEIALAYGLRPDVLTFGPLSGIYPVLTGYPPETILIARKRSIHPKRLPLRFDLERITPGEKRALMPLLHHHYKVGPEEVTLLEESSLEVAEQGIALSLARMSELELSRILGDFRELKSWPGIVEKYAIDLKGQSALEAAMAVRSSKS